MRNDQAFQLKLINTISRPLSIQIVRAQHVKFQKISMYRIHAFKKLDVWSFSSAERNSLVASDPKWTNLNDTKSWNSPKKKKLLKKRLYCQFGGLIKVVCTLNFYRETKRLIQTCTFNDSPNWVMKKWQIIRMLFSTKIMQSPTHHWSLAKNYWN